MELKNKPKKIIVGMSGGVDSSVTAALLKKAGFDVVGVMAKFWKEGASKENRCCSVESEKLARLVAKQIGIPFYVVNLEKEFKKKVVDYFLKEYKAGNTPNPCVVCNKEIKFGLLIEKALKMGGDFVATGHYARLGREFPISNFQFSILRTSDVRKLKLLKGKDKEKDQSYFLWQLNQKQLSKVLFPVGNYTKSQVRNLAKKFDLPTAETPESQEVCFVQNTTNDFLKKYLKTKPGNIIGVDGTVLGQHQGLWFYTIGQRRGLEIVGCRTPHNSNVMQGKPFYVLEKDFKNNILIVTQNEKDLLKKELVVKDINWINQPKLPINAEVKIRYKSGFAKARLLQFGKKIKVEFKNPQKAITPGQSAVFYKEDEVLGGGIIL